MGDDRSASMLELILRRKLDLGTDGNRPINLMAIGLNPERWEADRLYADDDGESVWPGPRALAGNRGDDLEGRGAVVAA